MNEILETIDCGNYTVNICTDSDPTNPREDNECYDLMICFHKKYKLGDEHTHKIDHFDGWEDMEKQLIETYEPLAILPLYLYDHSGITMSTKPFSCKWDSGQVGYILITGPALAEVHEIDPQELLANQGKYHKLAVEFLEQSVKSYDNYLQGNFCGYEVVHKEDDEVVASCWGYDDREVCKREGVDSAKWHDRHNALDKEVSND